MKTLTIKLNEKFADLLRKDLFFADFAISSLQDEMKPFEKKYSLDWKNFLSRFEKGLLGDERSLFKWYSLAKFTLDWYDTKKEIEKALGNT